jgi:hypothetical protein
MLACVGAFAKFSYNAPSFDSAYIIPSDLIIEGTIIQKSYFKDTSLTVRKYKFPQFTADSDGVWFVQYRVLVHKVFKGECKTRTIIFVEPNYDSYIYLNGNMIRTQYSKCPGDYEKFNYNIRTTGIFFLKDKYIVKLTFVQKNTYYMGGTHRSISGYQKIQELHIAVNDGSNKIEFDSIEQLYTYIESHTKRKRKDYSHTQFELLNTFDKVREYRYKYFTDSSGNYSFNSKLFSGEINQLNKDSFLYNKSRFNNKPHFADSNNVRLDTTSIRSIKRSNNIKNKTGA